MQPSVGKAVAAEERYRVYQERERAADEPSEERERVALRAQQQARCNRVQLCHQLDPSEANAQRVRDVPCWMSTAGVFRITAGV